MKICQALRSIREAKNLTAEQLALSVNVEPSTISRAERGERRISTDLLEKIAAAMSIGVTDLYALVEGRQLLTGNIQPDDALDLEGTLLKLRKILSGLNPNQRALILDLAITVARNSTEGQIPNTEQKTVSGEKAG